MKVLVFNIKDKILYIGVQKSETARENTCIFFHLIHIYNHQHNQLNYDFFFYAIIMFSSIILCIKEHLESQIWLCSHLFPFDWRQKSDIFHYNKLFVSNYFQGQFLMKSQTLKHHCVCIRKVYILDAKIGLYL